MCILYTYVCAVVIQYVDWFRGFQAVHDFSPETWWTLRRNARWWKWKCCLGPVGRVGPDDDDGSEMISVHHSQPISVVIQVVNHFWGIPQIHNQKRGIQGNPQITMVFSGGSVLKSELRSADLFVCVHSLYELSGSPGNLEVVLPNYI